jgi:hypothetical protein
MPIVEVVLSGCAAGLAEVLPPGAQFCEAVSANNNLPLLKKRFVVFHIKVPQKQLMPDGTFKKDTKKLTVRCLFCIASYQWSRFCFEALFELANSNNDIYCTRNCHLPILNV